MDLTIEDGTRLKVIYGSADGFHAVDLDTATVYDIYIPKQVSNVSTAYFFYLHIIIKLRKQSFKSCVKSIVANG